MSYKFKVIDDPPFFVSTYEWQQDRIQNRIHIVGVVFNIRYKLPPGQ